MEDQIEDHIENQIKNQIENWMENQNLIEDQTEVANYNSLLILPDHITFHILNQKSGFWHKLSSIDTINQ